MKHVILYEYFDLDKFMEDPEGFFHDDTRKEIEEGDYITSYRGSGQVLNIGPVYADVQLFNGPSSVVKIPLENLTKITKQQARETIENTKNSQRELNDILNQVKDFLEAIETTSEDGEEKLSGNLDSSTNFLEDVLIEVLSLRKKDPHLTQYQDFSNLVSAIATISHFIINQTPEEEIKDRISGILDKFYEISD